MFISSSSVHTLALESLAVIKKKMYISKSAIHEKICCFALNWFCTKRPSAVTIAVTKGPTLNGNDYLKIKKNGGYHKQ